MLLAIYLRRLRVQSGIFLGYLGLPLLLVPLHQKEVGLVPVQLSLALQFVVVPNLGVARSGDLLTLVGVLVEANHVVSHKALVAVASVALDAAWHLATEVVQVVVAHLVVHRHRRVVALVVVRKASVLHWVRAAPLLDVCF